MIEETFAFGLVIGCSLFGILWGTVNALLVSQAGHFPRFQSQNISFSPSLASVPSNHLLSIDQKS